MIEINHEIHERVGILDNNLKVVYTFSIWIHPLFPCHSHILPAQSVRE